MKIGIITFHKAANYGAVLQTYALQKSIEKLQTECEVIDYRCKKIEEKYKALNIEEVKGLKDFIKSLLYSPIIKIKNIKFIKFQNKYLNLSEKIERKDELVSINNYYDQFITGSDQVWNDECTKGDKAYLLDFVMNCKKKNSYAASFGVSTIDSKKANEYKRLLADFNKISVREKQGADIIQSLIKREAEVSLDPTLLLTKEEWLELGKGKIKYKNYILVYLMAPSNSIIRYAEELSQKTGCQIIHINSALIRKDKGKYIRTAGPEEFIHLFAEAKYIVTNSFHGTVFSINFNKDFFLELQPEPAKANARLENVMDLLELRDRQIIDGKNNNIYKSIDYRMVNTILEKERNKSKDYLKNVIGVINE